MAAWIRRAVIVTAALLVVACGSPVRGKFVDVNNPKRFYDFSWSGDWVDQDGDGGTSKVEGSKIRMQSRFTGFDGEVVGESEIHMHDVAMGGDEQYNTYRKAAE